MRATRSKKRRTAGDGEERDPEVERERGRGSVSYPLWGEEDGRGVKRGEPSKERDSPLEERLPGAGKGVGRGGSGWEVGPGEPGPNPKHGSSKRYTVAAKVEHLRDFAQSTRTLRAFCQERGLNTKSFCQWRRTYKALGEAGLHPKPNRRNTGGRTARVVSPEERRALVESYLRLRTPQAAFAKQFGISAASLTNWLRAYRQGGPKALEPKKRGRKKGSGGKPMLASSVQESIVSTKRRFPGFGLRKVRDYLLRFLGVKVSTGGVRNTLERAQIEPVLPQVKKRHRSADKVRRFERATPMDLWQSDITSYVLRRESRRVYLTVFLDDFSRYVVAFALSVRQTADLVIDSLLEGISRFGKPTEVLTDQGRQYFAWRGKSEFQKVLDREGIRHVVSRAHHPETLGKCERLWKSVGVEFWDRAKPQDLEDARTRMAHFFAHYNHFRPHQGLDGLVPADRFFGQEDAVRKSIEDRLAENELHLALDDPPRKKVFLMGQVGEQKVSLRGERGRLVIETEDGLLEAMELEEVGNDAAQCVRKETSNESIESESDVQSESSILRPDECADPDDFAAADGLIECADPAYPDGLIECADLADADVDAGRRTQDPPLEEAPLPGIAATGDRGAGIDRARQAGGTPKGALDVLADPGLVVGEEDQAGGGEAHGLAGASGLAIESARAVGDDCGTLEATAPSQEGRVESKRLDGDDVLLRSGTGPRDAEEEDSPAGTRAFGGESGQCGAAPVPLRGEDVSPSGGETWNCQNEEVEAVRIEKSQPKSGEPSRADDCGSDPPSGVSASSPQASTE